MKHIEEAIKLFTKVRNNSHNLKVSSSAYNIRFRRGGVHGDENLEHNLLLQISHQEISFYINKYEIVTKKLELQYNMDFTLFSSNFLNIQLKAKGNVAKCLMNKSSLLEGGSEEREKVSIVIILCKTVSIVF